MTSSLVIAMPGGEHFNIGSHGVYLYIIREGFQENRIFRLAILNLLWLSPVLEVRYEGPVGGSQ